MNYESGRSGTRNNSAAFVDDSTAFCRRYATSRVLGAGERFGCLLGRKVPPNEVDCLELNSVVMVKSRLTSAKAWRYDEIIGIRCVDKWDLLCKLDCPYMHRPTVLGAVSSLQLPSSTECRFQRHHACRWCIHSGSI